MTVPTNAAGSRGGPLVMLALLFTVWTGARATWWENPFPMIGATIDPRIKTALTVAVAAAASSSPPAAAQRLKTSGAVFRNASVGAVSGAAAVASPIGDWATAKPGQRHWRAPMDPQFAAAHRLFWQTSLQQPVTRHGNALGAAFGSAAPGGTAQGLAPGLIVAQAAPFFAGPPSSDIPQKAQRLSLDAWAFWRQGSGGAAISQGRAPIYGASQIAVLAQYRLAPGKGLDPRVYARGYRALVPRGETELALGGSARPFAKLPVRIAAEARLTNAASGNEVRPSAYAVTEITPIRLPLGSQLDAYGQVGWVGGASATAFADGQASITRQVGAVAAVTDNTVRLSIGAGAWGGAQQDAQRIDVGPTMRLDLTVGAVPARLSIDWRERVGGTATPDSGLAATLSTRF